MFELLLLSVSPIEPEDWEPIRVELAAIALVRIEHDYKLDNLPFLRFHPTLSAATGDSGFAGQPEVRLRFVDTYLTLMGALDKELKGSQPTIALEVLKREESNYRWAVAESRLPHAASLGDPFRRFLESTACASVTYGWSGCTNRLVKEASPKRHSAQQLEGF